MKQEMQTLGNDCQDLHLTLDYEIFYLYSLYISPASAYDTD
jgi:hypothetical protein